MRDDSERVSPHDGSLNSRTQIEPDRFELRESGRYHFRFSRREFLGTIGTVGAGVVVLISARGAPALAELPDGEVQERTGQISAWLHIAENGRVTIFTGKVEVGQDIRTSLTQAVMEELAVAPAAITLVMGDTDRTPYDAGTFGSRSTPQMGTQLRRAAAAARSTLLRLAAERWQVDAQTLALIDGRIADRARDRSLGIGELTRGEQLVQTIDANVATRPASDWRVAGTSMPKVSGRDIVTGRHQFTPDLKLPGMLTGKVLRPPAFGATVASVNTGGARAIEGAVVVHDGDFIGVAAPDSATAERAIARIDARWNSTPQPSHLQVFAHLKRTSQPGRPNQRGDVDAAIASASLRIEESYTAAYIAHVPLEPRAAVAQWEGGKLTGVDGHAATVRRAVRTRASVPHSGGAGACHRARHGIGVRRQTHRRCSDRSRAARSRGESRCQTRVDPRRRVYVGLLQARCTHRDPKWCQCRRHDRRVGLHDVQRGHGRHSDGVRRACIAHDLQRFGHAAATGQLPRPRRDREQLRAGNAHR